MPILKGFCFEWFIVIFHELLFNFVFRNLTFCNVERIHFLKSVYISCKNYSFFSVKIISINCLLNFDSKNMFAYQASWMVKFLMYLLWKICCFISVQNIIITHYFHFFCVAVVGIPWWWSIQTCHDVYGCFSREAPFINSNGYLPQNPKQLNVSLELHTRHGESMIDLTKYTSENHFDKSKKITVIIHGFLGSESVQWVQDMARELLKKVRLI